MEPSKLGFRTEPNYSQADFRCHPLKPPAMPREDKNLMVIIVKQFSKAEQGNQRTAEIRIFILKSGAPCSSSGAFVLYSRGVVKFHLE